MSNEEIIQFKVRRRQNIKKLIKPDFFFNTKNKILFNNGKTLNYLSNCEILKQKFTKIIVQIIEITTF